MKPTNQPTCNSFFHNSIMGLSQIFSTSLQPSPILVPVETKNAFRGKQPEFVRKTGQSKSVNNLSQTGLACSWTICSCNLSWKLLPSSAFRQFWDGEQSPRMYLYFPFLLYSCAITCHKSWYCKCQWKEVKMSNIWIIYMGIPKMMVPPKHPKMIIFSRKTHGCWVPPF